MASKALVVGSGAIGLRTALELLRRNTAVRLRSPSHPLHPSTCSMGAGGLWMPYHCDDSRVDRWSVETLDELLKISSTSPATDSDGENPIVEIVPTVVLKRDHGGPTVADFIQRNDESESEKGNEGAPENGGEASLPTWTRDARLSFQHLTTEMLHWQNHVHGLRIPPLSELSGAGYRHAWLFHPPIVDAPRMLTSMLREVTDHPLTEDVDVETGRYYASVEEMVADAEELGCDAVVNCTGLGSRHTCGDGGLVGGRGVLLHYDRRNARRRPDLNDGVGVAPQTNDCAIMTEEPPWASEEETCYVIPRGDTLCVGGTYFEGDEETGVREGERVRLTENARRMGIDVDASEIVGEWTGFRPVREMVRLEWDEKAGTGRGGRGSVRVVHNYGHGGSGWTVFVGAAREAASLLLDGS